MIVSYKTRNPLDSSVKFVTFIDAMLSLVVMQDVLLEFPGNRARGTILGPVRYWARYCGRDYRFVDAIAPQVDCCAKFQRTNRLMWVSAGGMVQRPHEHPTRFSAASQCLIKINQAIPF